MTTDIHALDQYIGRYVTLRSTWRKAEGAGCWAHPNLTWAASLCDRDAYPHHWRGEADLIFSREGENYVPEVAEMKLCMACERVARAHGLITEGEEG